MGRRQAGEKTMRKGWLLFSLGWALILGGGFLAHAVQTAKDDGSASLNFLSSS